jgi:integrase/recombinase XerD
VRDRSLLETLYSTGIRRMEAVRLGVFDVDLPRGAMTVRQGKGRKDRVVPMGARAAAWVEKYVQEVRPLFVMEPDPGALFLTEDGDPITPSRLTQMVRRYVDRAELGKRGSCHLWRHTCATLMLENGADIRFIQEMLGHADLSTTQIYTQVSIKKLQETHAATHPGARLGRPPRPDSMMADGPDPEPETSPKAPLAWLEAEEPEEGDEEASG